MIIFYLIGDNVTFCIENLSNSTNLYEWGLKPVFRVKNEQKWNLVTTAVNFEKVSEDWFTLKFDHEFTYDPSAVIYFAFTYPFGYEDVWKQLDQLEIMLQSSEEIYFKRELLTYSLDK